LLADDVYELVNFPYFKTLVRQNSTLPDKTLVILAGDFLSPSLLASLDKGRGMVDCMNASGITHVCLGNHETDVPMNDLASRIKVDSQFKWVNTNLRELDEKINVVTSPHEVVEVTNRAGTISKKVGLLGLLTDDPSVYRPGVFAGAKIEPVIPTTQHYMKDVIEPLDLDLVVPLTHQRINEDHEFCEAFGGSLFPIVIGGHDHEPYDETYADGSRVIKTGMDGENTAIIDLVWRRKEVESSAPPSPATVASDTLNGEMRRMNGNAEKNQSSPKPLPEIMVKMIPTNTYPADEAMLKRVAGHERILHELNRAKIFRFRDWLSGPDELFSTKNNRLGESNGTKILNIMLRMGMRAEIGLLNAGNVRGGKTYPAFQEWFTMSDLKAEIPFCVGICAVELPGRVIEDTINESRSEARQDPPVASGGYIHTCDKIEFSESEQRIISINGEPFDPDRMYLTSFPANWFQGMDDHKPLLEWAKDTPYRHAKSSSSKPSKVIIVELFAAAVWLEMGSFDDIDTNGDGVLTHDEVRLRALEIFGDDVADLIVDNIFSVADGDRDGIITPLDMMVVQFIASDMINHVATEDELQSFQKVASEVLDKHPTHEQVRKTMEALKDVLDVDKNGKITREEAMKSIGEVRRRSLLM
jgi:2',3'-cyclic-nucleotide 2'-phosphodiesterase (5'-nucleotidase family)/Ca2+-binding EF-hand superfamily protein